MNHANRRWFAECVVLFSYSMPIWLDFSAALVGCCPWESIMSFLWTSLGDAPLPGSAQSSAALYLSFANHFSAISGEGWHAYIRRYPLCFGFCYWNYIWSKGCCASWKVRDIKGNENFVAKEVNTGKVGNIAVSGIAFEISNSAQSDALCRHSFEKEKILRSPSDLLQRLTHTRLLLAASWFMLSLATSRKCHWNNLLNIIGDHEMFENFGARILYKAWELILCFWSWLPRLLMLMFAKYIQCHEVERRKLGCITHTISLAIVLVPLWALDDLSFDKTGMVQATFWAMWSRL